MGIFISCGLAIALLIAYRGLTPGPGLVRTTLGNISYLFRICLVHVSYISRSFIDTGYVRNK
jgi:hypothetical protein